MKCCTQKVMKLELTKEEMACCRKFANFLNLYAEDINDDMGIILDIVDAFSATRDDYIKEYLKDKYDVDIVVG